ncbi:glycosyltransferase [Portibacter lacus]|uniref:Glycosyl transferase family 1 domain-containing protein n=1 Tax=Portibacter lacus TaxID=1099794 RepID=A0AA37SSE4_9BACT|nr:glycosyltransferase [Portibacter lacus]GLR18864.1 hypothetical protein GCM10007940_34800 [Portibacter lacus]
MNKKTIILLNLVAIKKGGGQQVAVSFLNVILENKIIDLSFFIIATKGTILAKKLITQNTYKYILIENHVFKRAIFDLYLIRKIVKTYKIDLIYSLFGPPIFAQDTISVSGVAVSNIFYPEIKFWHGNIFYLLRKLIIDKYRLATFKKANALIFENNDMRIRGKELHGMSESIFIHPSISIQKKTPSAVVIDQIKHLDKKKYTVIMLTGVHPNKKIEAVIPILKHLKDLNEQGIDFAISISPSHSFAIKLMEQAKNYNLENNIKFLGAVNPEDVSTLSKNIDAYLLISLLESFSNNIIEAWSYERPLLITDADWSRSICNDAALYVDRENENDIALKILNLSKSKFQQKKLIEAGCVELQKYPSPEDKVWLQLDYLKKVLKNKK